MKLRRAYFEDGFIVEQVASGRAFKIELEGQVKFEDGR